MASVASLLLLVFLYGNVCIKYVFLEVVELGWPEGMTGYRINGLIFYVYYWIPLWNFYLLAAIAFPIDNYQQYTSNLSTLGYRDGS